jgi:hypothetical protein
MADSFRTSPIREANDTDVFDFSLWKDLVDYNWDDDESSFRTTELILEHGQRLFLEPQEGPD